MVDDFSAAGEWMLKALMRDLGLHTEIPGLIEKKEIAGAEAALLIWAARTHRKWVSKNKDSFMAAAELAWDGATAEGKND